MSERLKNSEFYSYSNIPTDNYFNEQVMDFVDTNLVGNIFHITSKERLNDIQSDGFLKATARYDTFGSQSKSCYGRKRGWVCLFDFRSVSDEQIENSCQCCLWELLTNKLVEPVVLIIHEDIHSKVKLQEEIKLDYQNQVIPGLYVPDTECWYPGNLSFEKTDVIETNFEK
jgi:hypothetical protein